MNVIVIGGGASGIMAGLTAKANGNDVTIIEKRERMARKLLITGKGRCNITNNKETVEDLIENIPGNGNFLYSAFYEFDNHAFMAWLEKEAKIKLKIERGDRVFPASDKAIDVVDKLVDMVNKRKIKVEYNTIAKGLVIEKDKVIGVKTDKGDFYCDKVILAIGGASYPLTGSTGDGYKIAKDVGHTIIPPKPSLVPLEVRESYIKDLQGLSLKNVEIKFIYKSKKELYSDFGEMLFTHFGVSGPIIISSSRHLLGVGFDKNGNKCELGNDLKLYIDLKPALDNEKLDNRLQRDFEKYNNRDIENGLVDLLPQKLIAVVLKQANIKPDKKINQITKEERQELIKRLKNLEFTIKGFRPIDEAIITAGGVKISEINPKTMESKIIKDLYFAGEIIDVDAYTGGFNLQIAFSTGFVAGCLQ